MVKALHINETMVDEPNEVMDLSDPDTPRRFFDNVIRNSEVGDEIIVQVKEYSDDEWAAIQRISEEEA